MQSRSLYEKTCGPTSFAKTHGVLSIIQDKSGKLWFATIDDVYIYDGKSFTPFIITDASGGWCNVEHILEDKAGNIWFGGRGVNGVYRYDYKSVINLKLKELSTIRFESVIIGHGLNCKTKTGTSGSAIGLAPTGMMEKHSQVLQKAMACQVWVWLRGL